jgi:hypothetical protein
MVDEDFPPAETVLAAYYAGRRVVCLGTLYPIFDDAAVAYMLSIAQGIVGGKTLGQCMQDAQQKLRRNTNHSKFDWSSYILLGHPDLVLSTELE